MQDIIEMVAPLATSRMVHKRTTLYYQGEIPRHAHIVTSGLVKSCSVSSTGEERIVALYSTGDIFPLPWVFGESTHTLFYYETVSDCEVMTLSRRVLLEMLNKEPAKSNVLQYVARGYTGLLLRVTALEQSRAAEKICLTLYYLMFHYGKETEPGIYSIDIRLTQPMIASLVGLARETIAINLNLLRRKGVVIYAGQHYSINKPQLEKFLGEDSFKDLVNG